MGIVIIGVGSDVQTEILKEIASSSSKGYYYYYYFVAKNNFILDFKIIIYGSYYYNYILKLNFKIIIFKGTYVFAKGDKSSIDEAFSKVAVIIQGQVVLEDI